MRVGIATDHGGFSLKDELVARLRAAGHDVVEFGAYALDPADDYPDFVVPLAQAVVAGQVERGVAICGSGVGASICANKVAGARAALVADHFSARQGVEDDHLNILCLGARTVGPAVAWDLVETFLAAAFSRRDPPSPASGQGGTVGGAAGRPPEPRLAAWTSSSRAIRCGPWPMPWPRGVSTSSPPCRPSRFAATSIGRPRSAARCASRRRSRAARSSRCSTSSSTECIPRSFNAASGGYLAFIPGGGLFPAALADFIANTTTATPASGRPRRRSCSSRPTRSTGCATGWGSRRRPAGCSPPAARWRPSTPSLCARERHLGAEIRRGVLYTSDQAHHSRAEVGEARRHHARSRARHRVDDQFRLPVGRAARGDRRRSRRRPDARSRSCRAPARPTPAPSTRSTRSPTCAPTEGLWHHVDGAYGAFFQLDPTLRPIAPRPVARRLADARSAQGHVPALRHRRAAGARRRGAARRARGHGRLPAGDAASRGFLRPEPARARSVARLPRACASGCA